jgi:hypothetical protein
VSHPASPEIRAGGRHVKRLLRRLALTTGWALALAVFFRWWDVKLRFPGWLFWTTVFATLYAATALVFRVGAPGRRPLWRGLAVWAGLVLLGFVLQAAIPLVTVRHRALPTALVLDVVDVVLALWIAGRGLALLWEPPLRWAVIGGALTLLVLGGTAFMVYMPAASHAGPPPPATREDVVIRERLKRHVRALAGTIGERNSATPAALERAAVYIERSLHDLGYEVATQEFGAGGRRFRNVEAVVPGAGRAGETVVIGAHYDCAPGVPGANDNASGVAAVLELARLLQGARPERTVRLVLFPNEEPPHFYSDDMGSRHYARRAAQAGERIVAMLSIETIGYYDDTPGSQQYPFPFNLLYPDRGDFIAFVGNFASHRVLRRSIGAFRRSVAFPSQGAVAPEWIPGVSWSDHASFWLHGYRAIMISDTAPYRYPHYHTEDDTPDRLDYDRMARVVTGLVGVVRELAGGTSPLSS